MLFQFKTKPEDFIVKEELGFKPSGKGDVFFVRFQKVGINTMDIVQHLCYGMKLQRKELGIAGLKDKNGITEQRITIYKKVLNRIGGGKKFLEILGQKSIILETNRHNEPLAVGKNAGNYFKIRLEAKKEISAKTKGQIESNIQKILKNGFPNCFGKQRFGKGYRNFYRAKEIFEGNNNIILNKNEVSNLNFSSTYSLQGHRKSKTDDFEIRFKLQAYASMYFNEYVIKRWKKGQFFLGGDIMVNSNNYETKVGVYNEGNVLLFNYEKCKKDFEGKNLIQPYYMSGESIDIQKDNQGWIPTGPMIGFNMLMPPINSKSRIKDNELLQETDFENKGINIAKKYNIYGFRRPLRTKPKNLKYEWDEKNNLIISFSLPTGSYATIFLGSILDGIDEKTLIENGLEIPLINQKTTS